MGNSVCQFPCELVKNKAIYKINLHKKKWQLTKAYSMNRRNYYKENCFIVYVTNLESCELIL